MTEIQNRQAHDARKAASQHTAGNVLTRYFIVHMHRLLDPSDGPVPTADTSGNPGA